MYEGIESEDQEPQQPALAPVEQESIAFHGDTIIAVRLADGRIAVVLRWICESLKIRPNGQVNRIKRTAAIAGELVRVKVQTRGGRQDMPAITLRGFPTWVLGLNPNEVKDDPEHPEQAERIRQMIISYQVEAVDVLYQHFAQKAEQRPALPGRAEANAAVLVQERASELEPFRPAQEPAAGASHTEQVAYHEAMALWHRWQADQHAQQWRSEVEEWRGTMEARIESSEAIAGLLPEILDRLGPETISTKHQTNIRGMVKQLAEASSTPYQTIYWELAQTFQVPRYDEILESHYTAVCDWFKRRMDATKKPR